MRFCYTSVVLILMVTSGAANTQTASPLEYVETRTAETADQAMAWGLSATEWDQYRQVMQDRRGIWSPGLDPITALGVSAETMAERKRFAELYVRTEFERTRQELAFQLAVDRAWARLYPDTPRIGQRAAADEATQARHRYALIVAPDCIECEALLSRRLAGMIDEAREGVDIHVVGTDDDDAILRRWISTQPALRAALKEGRATVNHGGPFQDLAHFPAIYSKTENGQWARER